MPTVCPQAAHLGRLSQPKTGRPWAGIVLAMSDAWAATVELSARYVLHPSLLRELTHRVASDADNTKDIWDKLSASGTFIGSVLIAGIVAVATYLHNRRQAEADLYQRSQDSKVNRVQTMGELIPYLSSRDARQVEAALVAIAELGDEELARRFAIIYQKEGGLGALDRLATYGASDASEKAKGLLQALLDQLIQSVTGIEVDGRPSATGFFVGDGRSVLTVAHGVRDKSSVRVLASGQEQDAVVTLASSDDVAVIRVPTPGRPLPLADAGGPSVGDRVYVLGYDAMVGQLTAEAAEIGGVRGDGSIVIQGVQVRTGFGGGPLVDSSGSVIGMIYRTRDANAVAGGVALPTSSLRKVLTELGE
jgi:S1-C subfamily serine protease